ncbi:mitochondrial folate transporter/carrier-like isoform X2 [Physella acuta]|uniref:mitochondrial folate transporter/carrier-like isoform X2 n=1 Tax=Physella acuta TaxID=109671 RepID=UPI0027DC0A82|nr:mitochondrial folate transporter/carrier-like isoform X2 [Physella acuta]
MMESKNKSALERGSASDATSVSTSKNGFSLRSHIRFEHLVAGVTGGLVSSIVLHPLDLIKVRFQVDEGPGQTGIKRPQYTGVIHAFRAIVQSDGWKGLYRGVTPNVTGAGLSWGLYFFFYNTTKTWMQDGDTTKNLGPGNHMWIASFAGLATLSLTNPIWVSKTRMCLQYGTPGNVHFVGMWETLANVYKYEGVRGLYRGYVPGVFGISHGALQFMTYEEMKTLYNKHRNQPLDTRLTSAEYLTFAALSKMVAAATTYPYQVVRSRLQDQHRQYSGVWDVVKQIWVFEGLYGYYKGLLPNLLRVTPACALTFFVYESIITFLGPDKKS